MRTTFLALLESVRSSYWLPPAAMAAAAAALAVTMLALDAAGSDAVRDRLPWAYTGGAEGAREVLGSIAASMMTVLSVTFSVTIVALTVASQQFGPRVLHNFIRRPGPQVVLGSFIASFVYSLIVLRTVRGGADEEFVPHLSVTIAVLLAGFSIAALIYFIHHVSSSIQASMIIAEIAADLEKRIEHLFPDRLARGRPDGHDRSPAEPAFGVSGQGEDPDVWAVAAAGNGYVQGVDDSRLMRIATKCDLVVRLEKRPGDFVTSGLTLALATPRSHLSPKVERQLRAAILVGPRRTPDQDVAFGLGQLLEIALRALSPSMNEPFLAITCIDRLIQALGQLAERAIPSPRRYDESGRLRVVAMPVTFVEAAQEVFDVLITPAASSPLVASRLLGQIGSLAYRLRREQDREALAHHALVLQQESREAAATDDLKGRIDHAYDRAMRALRSAVLAPAGPA